VILKAREVISIRGSRMNIGKLKEMVKAEKGEIPGSTCPQCLLIKMDKVTFICTE
jgi:hypothetical protein